MTALGAKSKSHEALILPIEVECPIAIAAQPLSIGLPFSPAQLPDPSKLRLIDGAGTPVPIQCDVLARWPDGSARWLLVDFVARSLATGKHNWQFVNDGATASSQVEPHSVQLDESVFSIRGGDRVFRIGRSSGQPLLQILSCGRELLPRAATHFRLTDAKGISHEPRIVNATCESDGPIRSTIRVEAEFDGRAPCRLIVRVCIFAGIDTVRVRATLHNPRRAQHRGGLWDLGDPGSIHIADLTMAIRLSETTPPRVRFAEEPGRPFREAAMQQFEIYQDSSGGENWRSRNHVNRFGHVVCSFRGYRIRTSKGHETGLRSNPVVRVIGSEIGITAAIPEFWQQFPKAIDAVDGALRLRLFPAQTADLHELQGGEQKTHTIWLNVASASQSDNVLDWVHQPARIAIQSAWCSDSGAFTHLSPRSVASTDRFDEYTHPVLEGPDSFYSRREIIDEFGWRNYGDVYADHENAHYSGPKPVISHFNNQFDLLFGAILQFARTGDQRWRELIDPLARHVYDIDIYHTEQDRPAYCSGLFWMTDHYLDAATCTHRTYSRSNRRRGQSYGGGPGSSHNFTTGLLYYYYLTGDQLARDAVMSLANWVIRMDDGNATVLSWIDDGPTGLASLTTESDYHGPGRGAGNSVNCLLDAWLLCGDRTFLKKGEQLIRRCIHPADEIAELNLLNAELRWSYPVFLVALARYLRCKAELGELDSNYAYGRSSLLHYAKWMLEHERPFLERRESLQFPTETWAAQEFRKANAMRLAAEHADDPIRGRLLLRATELADRAWSDLSAFDSPHTSRAVAILLSEGTYDQYFRVHNPAVMPPPHMSDQDFGAPSKFVSQKQNVTRLIRTPWKILSRIVRSSIQALKPSRSTT